MTSPLHDLLTFEDEVGVVTVTASFAPSELADGGPTAPRLVRAALQRLAAGDDERARALSDGLDDLAERLDDLLDPRTSGRGRLLVAGLGSGEVLEHRLQVPLPTEVTLGMAPTLRRVLEVVDEHRAAGVVLLHAAEALVLELELGSHTPVADLAVDLGDEVFADEFYGPAPPGSFHRGMTNREARADRIQANLDRFLDDVAEQVRAAAKDGGWRRIALVGPAHERNEVRDALDGSGLQVLGVDAVAGGPPQDVLDAVRARLTEAHRAEEVELVTMAVDRALSDGGAGAVGVVDVTRALVAGRVHHLLLSPGFDAAGRRGADGELVAADDDAGAREGLEPDPRFVHHLIERAFDTQASVTPVDDEAAELLDRHGEVAALLRW